MEKGMEKKRGMELERARTMKLTAQKQSRWRWRIMRNKGINKAERLKKQAQGLAAIPAKRLEAIVQIMRDGKVRRKTAERILPLAAKSMRDEIREFISMDSGAWAVPPERDKRVSGARKSKTCAWNSWGIDLSDFSAERMLR